eukprot:3093788-Prymnesium_polylepis.1
MQGGGGVRAGVRETASPACDARAEYVLNVRFSRFCCDIGVLREKKRQPCEWRPVAKVGPMDLASRMRCYISVLCLKRPESATIYWFYWGLDPSAGTSRSAAP